jgi:predicted O-linked N-acetylglucosamine transferase (SPINDLY family)
VRAVSLLDAGEAEQADLLLDLHLSRRPGDGQATAFHALARLALGDEAGAEILARRAMDLDPGLALGPSTLGRILLERGDVEAAHVFLDRALAMDPALEGAVRAKIAALKAQGRFEDIAPLLRATMAAAPERVVFPQLLSIHWRAMGDQAQALAAAHLAVTVDPEAHRSWRELGVCQLAGAPAQAAESLRRAIELGDDGAEVWMVLGVALSRFAERAEARAAYEEALARDPRMAETWTNLGNLLSREEGGERFLDEAIAAYREAFALDPDSFELHNNFSLALRDAGAWEEALVHARIAADLQPQDVIVLGNLANLLRQTKRVDEAGEILERALALAPNSAQNQTNMGLLRLTLMDNEGAERHFRAAVACEGCTDEVRLNLASLLISKGEVDEATSILEEILERSPENDRALMAQALLHYHAHRYERSVEIYDQILARKPRDWNALYSKSVAYWNLGRMVQALEMTKILLEKTPKDPRLLNLIGCLTNDVLDLEYANHVLREAVDLSPPGLGSEFLDNLCFNSHYGPSVDKDTLFARHREWDERYGAGAVAPGAPHDNDRDPNRPLRIGYVSPDFRRHSVAYFILPVIANHDRRAFEVYCYSLVRVPDTLTANIRENADHWRDIFALTPEAAANLIRADKIDILVDLAGHTAFNALMTFSLKPAPVQVTYLGYPNTTGLSAMDWRLTDVHADPEGRDEDPLSERTYRLPRTFLLYRPADGMPDVAPPPVLKEGRITFGTFNNLSKLSPQCLTLWREILEAVPDSRLLIKAKVLLDPETSDRVRGVLESWGMDMDRVDMVPYAKTLIDHMATYGQVDIALDTFPYNGTTTTFEALHMGVPVIGLRGTRHSARVGASILANLGLADLLLGESLEDARDKAVALATDLPLLTQVRAVLRATLARSPARQTVPFMRDMEDAYRDMWRQWVAGPPTHGFVPKRDVVVDRELESVIEPTI